MRIERLTIQGLKGQSSTYKLDERNLIVGGNGTGKSAVMDGVRFVLGQDPAGVPVNSPALVGALDGNQMSVEAVIRFADGSTTTIRRERRRTDEGMGRSALYVDGQKKGKMPEELGDVSTPAGRELIDMSPARLLAAVSEIGARDEQASEVVDALIDAVCDHNRGVLAPKVHGKSGIAEKISAAANAVHREYLDRKRDAEAAGAAAERSRQELGGARVAPGTTKRLSEQLKEVRQAYQQLTMNLGREQQTTAQARKKLTDLRGALESAGDGDGVEELEREVIALRERVEELAASEKQARHDRDVAMEGYRQAQREADRAAAFIEQANNDLSSTIYRAELLGQAACRDAVWLDVRAAETDPFIEPRELCTECLLSADAQQASKRVGEYRSVLDEARRRGQQVKTEWEAAAARGKGAGDAFANTEHETAEARRVLEAKERLLRQKRATGGGDISRIQQQIQEAEAKLARSNELEQELAPQVEQTGARVAELETEEREARLAEERLARLYRDREHQQRAEANRDEAADLMARVKDVRTSLREAGARRITEAAQPFLPSDWQMFFDDDGTICLADGLHICSSTGLSTAQRELFGFALDMAINDIEDRGLRLALIELDHIDLKIRRGVFTALERAVAGLEGARVSQVIACTWWDERRPGWQRIEMAPPSTPADAGEGAEIPEEADPFAIDHGWVDELEGPQLRDLLRALNEVQPGCSRTVPRAIEHRKELLRKLLDTIPGGLVMQAREEADV